MKRLEDRVLMSATPFIVPDVVDAVDDTEGILHAALSDGGDGIQVVDLAALIVSEDDVATNINLGTYFDDPLVADDQFNYEIVGTSGDPILAETILDGNHLEFRYAKDAFGSATVVVRGFNGNGSAADAEITVTALPMNDRPTTSGLGDVLVSQGQDETLIDLFAAFDDVEDADHELIFTVTNVSNASLFDGIHIDPTTGTLRLEYAEGANGTSDVTVRATDSDGAFVEMSTQGSEFNLYSNLQGEAGVHRPDGVDFDPIQLLTSWWFGQNEFVDTSTIDEATFRARIQTHLGGNPDQAVVLNLEDPAFASNTAAARENLAWALDILAEERPDLTNFGVYRLLPKREFWLPFLHDSAEQLVDLGVNVPSNVAEVARLSELHADWESANSTYRTDEIGTSGLTVSDRIATVFPSLYTFYTNRNTANGKRGVYAEASVDAVADTFTLHDNFVAEGMSVRLRAEDNGTLPSGLSKITEYYAINVNAEFNTFQLSASPKRPGH
jgi:hypothetical protein